METTFQNILDIQVAHYPLVDKGVITMDDVNAMVEQLVVDNGYEPEQFTAWYES